MSLISERDVLLFYVRKLYLLWKKLQHFCLAGLLEIYINGENANLLMILHCEMVAVLREVCLLIYK